VLRALSASGIRAVPFKGPALAVEAYGNLGGRSFCDLDILVQPKDLIRAAQILSGLGYNSDVDPATPAGAAYTRSECALQFQNATPIVLELHWHLVEHGFSCPIDMPGLWARLSETNLLNQTVPTLAAEDLLLYLCLHGTKHQWERLEWICSLAELIRSHPELNWTDVISRAVEWRCTRTLHLGLYLAGSLLGASIPLAIRFAVMADSAAIRLAAKVQDSLFTESDPTPGKSKRIAHYRFLFQSRERLADKLRIAFRSGVRTPHPESQELFSLPGHLQFLYYILRPLRIMGQYSLVAWRSYRK
jgi:hypothetical protein